MRRIIRTGQDVKNQKDEAKRLASQLTTLDLKDVFMTYGEELARRLKGDQEAVKLVQDIFRLLLQKNK